MNVDLHVNVQAILGMICQNKKAEIRLSEIWQRMRPTRPCREWPAENQNKVLYLNF